MKRAGPIPLGLRLRLDEPLTFAQERTQAEAIQRMEPYDRLPKSVRDVLRESPFDFNPVRVTEDLELWGLNQLMFKINRSIAINRREFNKQRQQALDWARESFRVGPRPKDEAPPGGWTVHNFNG